MIVRRIENKGDVRVYIGTNEGLFEHVLEPFATLIIESEKLYAMTEDGIADIRVTESEIQELLD